jgi:hypothetical protein
MFFAIYSDRGAHSDFSRIDAAWPEWHAVPVYLLGFGGRGEGSCAAWLKSCRRMHKDANRRRTPYIHTAADISRLINWGLLRLCRGGGGSVMFPAS